jgi:hypothetical protein
MSSISVVRTAIATIVTTSGITCYEYEDFELPKMPCATITMTGAQVEERGWTQGFGWGVLEFTLRNYVSLGGNAKTADTLLDGDMVAILTALGDDRTLGGKVTDIRVEQVERFYELAPAPRYAWCEWRLHVQPFPNIGA